MRSSSPNRLGALAATVVVALSYAPASFAQDAGRYGVGQEVKESALSSWNIDVGVDGAGLPPGRGSVEQGRAVYEAKCIACHGADGQGQPMDRLAGGRDTLKSGTPIKTIGSYWPYATTIFDYVRRAMPLDRPQSLTADEVYAVTAYLLHLNGLVSAEAVMNVNTLPAVRMPNVSAFRTDPRPDVVNSACQRDCRPAK